ncbi:MAG: response regulator transcription factor [Candidatus Cloacimonetes bacterium]|nr:response regulator transcription factor [Candidatus Cloacimonadota bacterium]
MKIVVIEDDKILIDYLTNVIRLGWSDSTIHSTHLGEKGITFVEEQKPDIVILDLGLPDISGFEVLKEIRAFSEVPIVILSARSSEYDVVQGLNLGADEYIIKPFRNLELLARLRCIVRKHNINKEDNLTITYGPFSFGDTIRDFKYANKEIRVTDTEGQILHSLMLARGKVVSITTLSKIIWGSESTYGSEGIKVYIYRLRQKLESNPNDPKLILNKPGAGYYLISPC